MGLTTDLVIDAADEINFELNSPFDISISFISFWLRRNIGKLNNLIGTTFTITTDSPYNFSTALSEEQKDIYKHLFKIYYWQKKINDNLGSSSFDIVQEVTSDSATVRMVNKNEISKTYLQLRNQEIEALKNMVNGYKLGSFDPLAVQGDDYIAINETADTSYARTQDKYVT